MNSGAGVPASEERSEDGRNAASTNVALRVKHLAHSSQGGIRRHGLCRVGQARNASRQNVGSLSLNDDLEGSLDTTTVLPPVRTRPSHLEAGGAMAFGQTRKPVFTSHVNRAG